MHPRKLCQASRDTARRQAGDRYGRKHEGHPDGEIIVAYEKVDYPPRQCSVCGSYFKPRSENAHVCPNLDCKKENHRILNHRLRSKSRQCVLCGRSMAPEDKIFPSGKYKRVCKLCSEVNDPIKEKVRRKCLKCGKEFMDEVLRICPTCTTTNRDLQHRYLGYMEAV